MSLFQDVGTKRQGKPRARGGKDPVAPANGRRFPFLVVQRPTQWHTEAASPAALRYNNPAILYTFARFFNERITAG